VVKEVEKEGEELYVCETCSFRYKEKAIAEKCQDWCDTHKSCSLEITKHAVERE